jgi:hypothetical protein
VEAALDGRAKVIDPLPHAIQAAVVAARAGERTDKTLYPTPERKRVIGFGGWPALDAAINSRIDGEAAA